MEDATLQHGATWPAIENVIRHRAAWGPSIVIDGWALRPQRVAKLGLDNVHSFWLLAGPGVLKERERQNSEFFGKSHDPERMLQNFLGRSLWYNDLIKAEATRLRLPILLQEGNASVESLCAAARGMM